MPLWWRRAGKSQGATIDLQGSNHPYAPLQAMGASLDVDTGEPKQEFLCGFGCGFFGWALAKEVTAGGQFLFAAAVGQHSEIDESS